MPKVLKADGSAGDALVQFDFGASQSDVWITLDLLIPAAMLAACAPGQLNYGPNFLDLLDSGTPDQGILLNPSGVGDEIGYLCVYDFDVVTFSSPLNADEWHTLELHVVADSPTDTHVYLDGALVRDDNDATHNVANWESFAVGLRYAAPDARQIYYLDNVKAGTTRGGSELFSDDFESGTLDAWTSTSGGVSVTDDPGGGASAIEGICIAFEDSALEPTPTWTRIDTVPNLVAEWEVKRGRSYELDQTEPGTATVTINDRDGLFDPTNVTSPYNGMIEPLKQAAIALWNPVDEEWETVFRGFVDDWNYALHPSERVMVLTLELVDALAILADIEVAPGTAGTAPPPESVGDVWYEDANVDDRIIEALADAGWPPALTEIFSGNVTVQEKAYSPRTTILQIVQEAAEAEFPGVANVYASKEGLVTFHGRLARFNPDNVDYNIDVYKAGDGEAIGLDPDRAQIRGLSFNRGKTSIINAALATPQRIHDADIEAQLVTDAPSIDTYFVKSWSAENLLTETGLLTGNLALAETKLFATYYVSNYKAPQTRVTQIVFRSLRPTDARALRTWRLLTRVELSDLIDLETYHPGGGGFAEQFYVEGIQYAVRPLNPDYDDVTLTLDVSPKAYYNANPFEDA